MAGAVALVADINKTREANQFSSAEYNPDLKHMVVLPELVNITHLYSRFSMIKALVGAIKHDTFLLETYDGISALSI
jgi:hypothetical protein